MAGRPADQLPGSPWWLPSQHFRSLKIGVGIPLKSWIPGTQAQTDYYGSRNHGSRNVIDIEFGYSRWVIVYIASGDPLVSQY